MVLGGHMVIRLRPLLRQRLFFVAMLVAVPNALITCGTKYMKERYGLGASLELYEQYYGMFGAVLSLLIAFRASQSYSRFWEGTNAIYQMVADFQDAAGSLFAFSNTSKKSKEEIDTFQHILVRLFSVLHVLILADLSAEGMVTGEEAAFDYELIDPLGLDDMTMMSIAESNKKVDLVFQWIQAVVVQAANDGVINVPPPILTRSFGELNAGMIQFHSALKIAEVPFPFPYSAAAEIALIIHWFWTPIFVAGWSNYYTIIFSLSFVQIFMFWSLSFLAVEMENPFGGDMNDLDVEAAHNEFNERLVMLLSPASKRVPALSGVARLEMDCMKTMHPSRRVSGSGDVLSLGAACERLRGRECELASTDFGDFFGRIDSMEIPRDSVEISRAISIGEDSTSEVTSTLKDPSPAVASNTKLPENHATTAAPPDKLGPADATPDVLPQSDDVMARLTFEIGRLACSLETLEHHMEASATGPHLMQLSATIESLKLFLAKPGRESPREFYEHTDHSAISFEDMHAVVDEEIAQGGRPPKRSSARPAEPCVEFCKPFRWQTAPMMPASREPHFTNGGNDGKWQGHPALGTEAAEL